MNPSWEEIRKNAKNKTDESFVSAVSSLTRLTDDEIKAIAPTVSDKENFAALLKIINDATKSNEEKAKSIRNINGLVEIVIPLLKKLL